MTIISCQCGKQFKAQPHLWGKRVACPSCKQPLEIPTPPPIAVSCLCGQSFRAKPELAGKTLACPKCGNSLQVPLPGAAQPSPTPEPFDIPQQPIAQPQNYQRPVTPAAKSAGDSSAMAIKFAIGIGGGAVVLLLLFLVGSMLWSPSDKSETEGGTVVAEAEPSDVETTSTVDSDEPPPTISADESRDLPTTAAELEEYYRLPPGAEDTTELWTSGISAFSSQRFLDEAAAYSVLTDGRVAIPTPDQSWPELDHVKVILGKAQPALDKLHLAADKGSAARYPTQFADGFAMLLPELQELRDASRILKVQAFVHARDGDASAVARNIRTMLSASTSVGNFPLSVPCLVRLALLTDTVDTLQKLLPHVQFSHSELESLTSALLAQDLDQGLYNALVGERAVGIHGFTAPEQTLRSYSENFAPTPLTEDEMQTFVKNVAVNIERDQQTFESLMNQMLAVAKLPSQQRLNQATVGGDLLDRMRNGSSESRRTATLTLLLIPHLDSLFSAVAMCDSRRSSAVIAIAIEQFKMRENKLPETLSQLVPNFISNVPIDPYNGQPLNYGVDSNRYVVYSVGDNRRDDGGSVANASDFGVEVLLATSNR